jgi:hypothetical protein
MRVLGKILKSERGKLIRFYGCCLPESDKVKADLKCAKIKRYPILINQI